MDTNFRSCFFEDLDEIGNAFEIKMKKKMVNIKRPFQIGIAVYQLAKLRMLEFYYDFLDIFIDRSDFECLQMDTDSMYLALSKPTLEECIKPEMRERFESEKKDWFPTNEFSNRKPGLFKKEFEGDGMISLTSKCYFARGKKSKFSSKGIKNEQNEITWQRFKNALTGSKDEVVNIGFRKRDNRIFTYQQNKIGFECFLFKKFLNEDGIHTKT